MVYECKSHIFYSALSSDPNNTLNYTGEINNVSAIKVEESIDNLTSKAKFIVPLTQKLPKTEGGESDTDLLLVNEIKDYIDFEPDIYEFVRIRMWYNNEEEKKDPANVNPHISGFITNKKIISNSEVEITVEDPTYILKSVEINLSRDVLTLEELHDLIIDRVVEYTGIPEMRISEFIGRNPIINANTTLRNVRFNNITVSKVFEYLSEKYLIDVTAIKGELDFDSEYQIQYGINFAEGGTNYVFSEFPKEFIRANRTNNFTYNFIISKNLTFKREEDVNYKVKYNVIRNNGQIFPTGFVGDEEGDKREVYFYGDYTQAEAEDMARQKLNQIKYTGFTNDSSFITFGELHEFTQPDLNDVVIFDGVGDINLLNRNVMNSDLPIKKAAGYNIDAITHTMDESGFKAEITIGVQVAPPGEVSWAITNQMNNQ